MHYVAYSKMREHCNKMGEAEGVFVMHVLDSFSIRLPF